MGRVEISRKEYAKSLESKEKFWILQELAQNVFDLDNCATCEINVSRVPGKHQIRIIVRDDDPAGFQRMTDIWTLWAESLKVNDASKRGRFNEGDKKIFLYAEWAEVATTKGTVVFEGEDRHEYMDKRTDRGSAISVIFKASVEDYDQLIERSKLLMPPKHIALTVNGDPIPTRVPLKTFEETLPSVIGATLEPTQRKTEIEVHKVRVGEAAMLYEGGIPIVETDDTYHINVNQRVPLSRDRDSVSPAYLKKLRAYVLNHMHAELPKEDFTKPWVSEAVQDKHVDTKAVNTYLTAKYGEKRAIFDATNPESMSRLQAQGYSIIHGRQENGKTWDKIKEGDLARPAGVVLPVRIENVNNVMPESEWTNGMKNIANYSKYIASKLISGTIHVSYANDFGGSFAACYGARSLTWNIGRLGRDYFNHGPTDELNRLLIHELSHHHGGGDHLSEQLHDEACELGAKLAYLVSKEPDLFRRFGRED